MKSFFFSPGQQRESFFNCSVNISSLRFEKENKFSGENSCSRKKCLRNSSKNPQQLKKLQKLFSFFCRSLSWNVRKTNILLTLMCIGAHKFVENSLLLISFSRLTSFYWSGKRAFAGFCCVHKYLCNRLKETSGLEDWFIDSKPDELKFIGITYIVESKKRIRKKSPWSQNFFFGVLKRKFSLVRPNKFHFRPFPEKQRKIQEGWRKNINKKS